MAEEKKEKCTNYLAITTILLSSISALTKREYIWYLSLVVGAVGVLYFFNGFFQFIN